MDPVSFSHAEQQKQRIEKVIANPDSTSGIVTVPKVIVSGETITIPSGRVAVLPNVQVDGTLSIEGEVFIPSGATLSKVVETTGDQTISGVKTFTSSPIVPTPTTGTQAVNKDYADTKTTLAVANSYDIGVGQTWQDVTASRSVGVTYTNTTGKPIYLSVLASTTSAPGTIKLTIDGIKYLDGNSVDRAGYPVGVCGLIPNASTYEVYITSSSIDKWAELR